MTRKKTGLVGLQLSRIERDKRERIVRAEFFQVWSRIDQKTLLVKRLLGIEADESGIKPLRRDEMVTFAVRETTDKSRPEISWAWHENIYQFAQDIDAEIKSTWVAG